MTYRGAGPGAYALTIAIAAAMMTAAALLLPSGRLEGAEGLCLPSPNLWNLQPAWSRVLNGLLLGGASLWMLLLNKRFNFVRLADFSLPSLFLLFACCNPFAAGTLGTSTLLALFTLLACNILFPAYERRNATQEVFATATFLALGSMVDYAFLAVAPMWVVVIAMLKIFRWRELIAFGMGLAAPYWVALGLGIVPPTDFHWPQLTNLFNGYVAPSDILTMLCGVAVLWLFAAICALGSMVRLYAGNPRPRTYNYIFYLILLYSALAMAVDSDHLTAYLGQLITGASVAVTNLFALNPVPRPKLAMTALYLLCIGFWALLVLF